MANSSTATSGAAVLDLTGERTPISVLLRDLRRQRHLLVMLANRDFKAKYRSTNLGLVWAVLLPLIQGTVLALVFTHVVHIQARTASYPVFVLAGMATWTYLSSSVQSATTSILDQSDIAGRIYFPRMFLPGVAILAAAPGLLASLIVVIPISVVLGVTPTWHFVALPLGWLLAVVTVYAIGAPLALLNVYFRDVKYFVVAALQALLYGSPVIYPLDLLGDYKAILYANPASGIIELVRWSFDVNGKDPVLAPLAGTAVWIIVMTGVTVIAYARQERLACDRL
ncbi:MAG TPA: ABC transporter permease [Mycobacteriales bacterium]|nr:ABC transporter permease [Mycobacteriales bacterium]